VCLALYSGEAAGHAVDAALTKQDFSAAHFEEYGRLLCASIESMRALVYTFYNHEWSFRKFIDKYPDLSADMTDCLMGKSAARLRAAPDRNGDLRRAAPVSRIRKTARRQPGWQHRQMNLRPPDIRERKAIEAYQLNALRALLAELPE
jgi:hypothetical protein